MAAVTETSMSAAWPRLPAWLPLAVLPAAVACLLREWPAWVFMWGLAVAIYAGLKWLSFADFVNRFEPTVEQSLAYLLLWPGMDAQAFLASRRAVEHPRWHEWLSAGAKLTFGAVLIGVAADLVDAHPGIGGWIGMAGLAFTLHFGLFHVLSVFWRAQGFDATPIMDAPILATSLSDFWGRRWNLAFRDLAHTYVFRPLAGRFGVAGATMVVFLVSGILHDVVISFPAGGGFGLPTLYFAVQGVGVLFERSRIGKRLGARNGAIGRLFCAAVTLGPVFLLFHQPFVERVMVPMLRSVG